MKQRIPLSVLLQRSASRLQDAEKMLERDKFINGKAHHDNFMERFLLRESSILLRLAVKFWLRLRFAGTIGKFQRK